MGNRCFYPPIGRVYIARSVVFDETTFSFEDPGNLCAFELNNNDISTSSNCSADQINYRHHEDQSLDAVQITQTHNNSLWC